MSKTYVLDTNVLLSDANCIYKFEEHNVYIPVQVIAELDTFKKDKSELGRNARQVARNLNELMAQGDLSEGVVLNELGGILRVTLDVPEELESYFENTVDNEILATARYYNGIVISKDINVRIKAAALKIPTQDYKNDKVKSTDGLYTGVGDITLTSTQIDELYERKFVTLDITDIQPKPNQCFIIKSDSNEKHSALVCYTAVMNEFRLLPTDLKTLGILPRNTEQQFALSLLLDPNIRLVTLTGKAGSGKGLMSLAAALKQVLEDKVYTKIVIARPIVSLNNSHQLGFMPGTMQEKLSQWIKPFLENANFIMENSTKPVKVPKQGKRKKDVEAFENEQEKEAGKVSFVDELINFGLLELCSLESIKGRTLHGQILLVTECQDCTRADVKAIVTRAGEGTKIVLEGDIYQTDNPYLDSESNGLSYVIDKFKDEKIAAHITLQKSERSELAELAANIL